MDLLAGRLALVTGAGRGNGAAIARGLARAGARVIVTDLDRDNAHDVAESIVAAGGDARGYMLDVADSEGCARLAADLELLVGPVRILVNNAGIFLRGPLLGDDARTRWDTTMTVNVEGAFNVTLAFAGQLRRTGGVVVNVASVNSFVAPPGSGVYSVSKGAIAQLTRVLASELAADGVRVNAIAPGIIATPMTEVTRADEAKLQLFLNHVPMRRVGEPEELAGPVVFLCSDWASYVTGAILAVDGGFLAV
ncbi:MAG: SDR family NAD(P)-dependent oxidoreductase [Pseudomonadota bacterium]